MTAVDPFFCIKALIAADWVETPVAYSNGGWFVPGDDAVSYDPDAEPERPWLALEMLGAGSDCTSAGSPGKRLCTDDYVIMASVFTPIGTGEGDARRICRAIGDLFRLRRLNDGVSTGAPTPPGNGGSGDDDGRWFRLSVSIPLHHHYLF